VRFGLSKECDPPVPTDSFRPLGRDAAQVFRVLLGARQVPPGFEAAAHSLLILQRLDEALAEQHPFVAARTLTKSGFTGFESGTSSAHVAEPRGACRRNVAKAPHVSLGRRPLQGAACDLGHPLVGGERNPGDATKKRTPVLARFRLGDGRIQAPLDL
jgi:hypothetical protein